MNTAVLTACVHGRVPCTRPFLWPVYTAIHDRVRTVFTTVHDRNTAVFTARAQVYGRVCGPSTQLCTWSVYDHNTAVFTARVHVRTMYTAVHRPCKWSVHDPNTAALRPVHGRVPCTRLSLQSVYTAVDRPLHGLYTAEAEANAETDAKARLQ